MSHSIVLFSVKSFSGVEKCSIASLALLSAFLLRMTKDKYHVRHASVNSEATLSLWEVIIGDGWSSLRKTLENIVPVITRKFEQSDFSNFFVRDYEDGVAKIL